MKAQVRAVYASCAEYWQARTPPERLIISIAVFVLGGALCLWLVHTVDRSRTELRNSLPALRARAGLLDQHAVEFERLRAAPAVTVSQSDLRALVQAQAGAAGLSRALVSAEAADVDQVKVVFGAVAFADWLDWVAGLEAQHIHLDACRIEALAAPGMVSITATLARPKQQ
jgi:general secretion pathway protein M